MRNLKIIAKKYDIAIFIMAHTGKSREDGTVGIDNIRDSSFVAQESDNWPESRPSAICPAMLLSHYRGLASIPCPVAVLTRSAIRSESSFQSPNRIHIPHPSGRRALSQSRDNRLRNVASISNVSTRQLAPDCGLSSARRSRQPYALSAELSLQSPPGIRRSRKQ